MVGSISKLSLYVNCKSVLCRILYIVEGEEQKQYARTLVQVCIFRTFCMAHRDVSMMWESHSSYKWQIARLRDFKIYLYKFSKILTYVIYKKAEATILSLWELYRTDEIIWGITFWKFLLAMYAKLQSFIWYFAYIL